MNIFSRKKFLLSILAGVIFARALLANPSNPTIVEGNVTFNNPSNDTLLVESSSTRSIINWDSFSIDGGETTSFTLPSASSVILNRVTSALPSDISGNLDSNGIVYLINPNGIMIGSSGIIDVNGFLASTLDVLDSEFMAGGDMNFFDNSSQAIEHNGVIFADTGDVILLGFQITNSGSIYEGAGNVALAAGLQLVLHPAEEDKISIVLQSPVSNSLTGIDISATGYIDTIRAELKADGNLYAMAINHQGWINANGTSIQDGKVLLTAEAGNAQIDGNIKSLNIDNTGGNVEILANNITLDNNCVVDTSGIVGGGTIHIGSGFEGMGTPFNAQNVLFELGAQLNADAGSYNNGGEVVVWADNSTNFYGTITSRGGLFSGNGGLVEISGVNSINFSGSIDNTAPQGQSGTIIMDPQTLIFNPLNIK